MRGGSNMTRFDYCFDIVLGAEGGFVDHASDKGGRTNYGITQKTLDEFQLSHSAPTYDVKDITVATAKVASAIKSDFQCLQIHICIWVQIKRII